MYNSFRKVNYFHQHISDIRSYLIKELNSENNKDTNYSVFSIIFNIVHYTLKQIHNDMYFHQIQQNDAVKNTPYQYSY